ncbi:uncharacterized protein DS421_15g515820 [Arachis hypogaea]|nr:uncharacterized protein DS421_15g515820 [Arachis hypogaea]
MKPPPKPASCPRLSVSALSSLASAAGSRSPSPRHSLKLGAGSSSLSRRQFITLSSSVRHSLGVTLGLSPHRSLGLSP